MRFDFDSTQTALRESARKFLAKYGTGTALQAASAKQLGYDPETWRKATEELGWGGVAIPEDLGGFGLGHVAMAGLLEEMGYAQFCSPFLGSIGFASTALAECGKATLARATLPSLADGSQRAALAWRAQGGGPESLGVSAEKSGADYVLRGEAHYVVGGGTATTLVILASSAEGPVLVRASAGVSGLEQRITPVMDPTRGRGAVILNEVSVPEDDVAHLTGEALARIFDLCRVGLAAEMVGGAQRTLDMAVEYAKERRQFGRAIGSFQAVKHMCADMMVQVESARSAAYFAAWAADASPESLPKAAAMAKAYASDAFFYCASQNIQIHGGIGFTWEHDAHFFFKRARASAEMLGNADWHRSRIADWVL